MENIVKEIQNVKGRTATAILVGLGEVTDKSVSVSHNVQTSKMLCIQKLCTVCVKRNAHLILNSSVPPPVRQGVKNSHSRLYRTLIYIIGHVNFPPPSPGGPQKIRD